MRTMILLLISLAVGSVALGASQHDFKLEELRLAGCKIEGGRVVLDRCFDQGAEALDLIANPPTGQADAACSGGKCVVRVDRALFPFRITRAGRYARYVRGYFPQGGGWLHSESLDHGRAEWYTDCDGATGKSV